MEHGICKQEGEEQYDILLIEVLKRIKIAWSINEKNKGEILTETRK